ncbi:MAG: cell division control protein Cdc6, partial [Halanaeroarchaeum sp.]
LAMLGIISVTERNEGRRGGTYREYELDMPVEQVLSALSETVELVGVHESVVELAEDVVPEVAARATADAERGPDDGERDATDAGDASLASFE